MHLAHQTDRLNNSFHPTPTPTATRQYFKVFPDVVVGHSAGEVAAAYASGLLTLEEACEVVYHRSAEQQKMAGCGRLLAVGMSEEKVQDIIRGMADIEIACVNSPESVVLASSEERLKEVAELLPEGTMKALVPGNIAFHSSRVEPILGSMKQRLSFLDKRPKTWGLPYISSVTGKLESTLDASYWCVRACVRGFCVCCTDVACSACSRVDHQADELNPNPIQPNQPHPAPTGLRTCAAPCSSRRPSRRSSRRTRRPTL